MICIWRTLDDLNGMTLMGQPGMDVLHTGFSTCVLVVPVGVALVVYFIVALLLHSVFVFEIDVVGIRVLRFTYYVLRFRFAFYVLWLCSCLRFVLCRFNPAKCLQNDAKMMADRSQNDDKIILK